MRLAFEPQAGRATGPRRTVVPSDATLAISSGAKAPRTRSRSSPRESPRVTEPRRVEDQLHLAAWNVPAQAASGQGVKAPPAPARESPPRAAPVQASHARPGLTMPSQSTFWQTLPALDGRPLGAEQIEHGVPRRRGRGHHGPGEEQQGQQGQRQRAQGPDAHEPIGPRRLRGQTPDNRRHRSGASSRRSPRRPPQVAFERGPVGQRPPPRQAPAEPGERPRGARFHRAAGASRPRPPSRPPTGRAGNDTRYRPVPLGRRSSAALNPDRRSEARSAASGAGTAPPGRRSSPARLASRSRRPAAFPSARLVRDDPQDPRPKRRPGTEATERSPRLDEGLLGRVFGIRLRPGVKVRGAMGDLLVSFRTTSWWRLASASAFGEPLPPGGRSSTALCAQPAEPRGSVVQREFDPFALRSLRVSTPAAAASNARRPLGPQAPGCVRLSGSTSGSSGRSPPPDCPVPASPPPSSDSPPYADADRLALRTRRMDGDLYPARPPRGPYRPRPSSPAASTRRAPRRRADPRCSAGSRAAAGGAHRRVHLLDEQLRRVGRQIERQLALRQRFADSLEQQLDDVGDLLLGQLVEDDHLVDAVEELGPEHLLQLAHDAGLHVLVGDAGLVADREPDAGVLGDLRSPTLRS